MTHLSEWALFVYVKKNLVFIVDEYENLDLIGLLFTPTPDLGIMLKLKKLFST